MKNIPYWNKLDAQTRRAALTILASGFATGIKFLFAIISIPLTIGYLGSKTYGLISTILTICIWVNTIADGGIGLSLKNAIIKKRAQGSEDSIASLGASAFFVLLVLIILLCCILSILTPFLNWKAILNLQILLPESQLVGFIIVLLWSTLLIIPFSLPKLIYSAYQKEYLFSGWLVLGSLLGISLLIITIKSNRGIIWVGSALQIGALIGALFGTLWFIYKKPIAEFSFKKVKLSIFKDLLSPSLDFFVLQLTALAIFQSGVFLTNFYLGQQAAAIYSLHFQLFSYFQLFATLIISPFWSVISEAYHQNNTQYFKKTLLRLVLGITLLTILFCVFILLFGKPIIGLLSHHQIAFNFNLMILLATYHLFSITAGVLSLALLSVGDTRMMCKIVMFQAILTLVLSSIFIQYFSVLGAALGSLASIVLTILWYSPWRMCVFYKKWSFKHGVS